MGGKGKGKGKGKAKGKTKGKFSKDKPAPKTSPKHVAPADGDHEATDAAPAAPAPKAPRPRNRRRQKQEEAEASLPTSKENKSEEGHYTTVVSLIGELTLHTVTHYLASMVLGMIHLVAVKCINFVEQSQRRAQLTVSAFPLVVFDALPFNFAGLWPSKSAASSPFLCSLRLMEQTSICWKITSSNWRASRHNIWSRICPLVMCVLRALLWMEHGSMYNCHTQPAVNMADNPGPHGMQDSGLGRWGHQEHLGLVPMPCYLLNSASCWFSASGMT